MNETIMKGRLQCAIQNPNKNVFTATDICHQIPRLAIATVTGQPRGGVDNFFKQTTEKMLTEIRNSFETYGYTYKFCDELEDIFFKYRYHLSYDVVISRHLYAKMIAEEIVSKRAARHLCATIQGFLEDWYEFNIESRPYLANLKFALEKTLILINDKENEDD